MKYQRERGATLTQDEQRRLVAAHDAGVGIGELIKRFRVPSPKIYAIMKTYRARRDSKSLTVCKP